MAIKEQIKDYLSQTSRNRLVFCHEHIDGLIYVDVGRTMSESLAKENLRSPMIAYAAEDLLSDILSATNVDSSIGCYIALENIGILFEPELGFNLRTVFENTSTNKTLIICYGGHIYNNDFYFLTDNDVSNINLQGLSYLEIK
jgi:hypothetical protein